VCTERFAEAKGNTRESAQRCVRYGVQCVHVGGDGNEEM